MMKKYVYKSMIISAIIALTSFLIAIITSELYDKLFFNIGALAGIIFTIISLVLMFVNWIIDMRNAVKSNKPIQIIYLILGAVIVIYAISRRL